MKTGSILVILFLLVPNILLAHPGGTDSYGCHTCRTNCSDWGLYYGEYHCHQAKSLPQPEDPIHSKYGDGGTGYTYPAPDYSYPSYNYNPTPSCPLFSSYDLTSESCKCNYGYIVDTDFLGNQTCVSGNSYCYDKYGYNSSYDSLSNSCECDYGYTIINEQCTSYDDYCEDLYGYYSSYNSLYDKCECDNGYVMGKDIFGHLSCIDGDSYCHDLYGYYSSYGYFSKVCECDYGYELINGECAKEIEEEPVSFNWSSFLNNIKQNSTNEVKQAESVVTFDDLIPLSETPEKIQTNNLQNNQKIEEKTIECNEGYTLSLNKKECIFVPEHAHVVNSITDVWLCDEEYKEVGNSCVKNNEQEKILSNQQENDLQDKQISNKEFQAGFKNSNPEQKTEEIKLTKTNILSGIKNLFNKLLGIFRK